MPAPDEDAAGLLRLRFGAVSTEPGAKGLASAEAANTPSLSATAANRWPNHGSVRFSPREPRNNLLTTRCSSKRFVGTTHDMSLIGYRTRPPLRHAGIPYRAGLMFRRVRRGGVAGNERIADRSLRRIIARRAANAGVEAAFRVTCSGSAPRNRSRRPEPPLSICKRPADGSRRKCPAGTPGANSPPAAPDRKPGPRAPVCVSGTRQGGALGGRHRRCRGLNSGRQERPHDGQDRE